MNYPYFHAEIKTQIMKKAIFAFSMLMMVGIAGTTVYASTTTNGIEIKKDDDKKKKKKKSSKKSTEAKSCCASKAGAKTCTKKK